MKNEECGNQTVEAKGMCNVQWVLARVKAAMEDATDGEERRECNKGLSVTSNRAILFM